MEYVLYLQNGIKFYSDIGLLLVETKSEEIMDPLLLSNKGDGFIQVGLIFSLNASGELCNKDVQLLLPLLTKNAVTQVTLTKVPYKLSVITTQEKTNPAINSY